MRNVKVNGHPMTAEPNVWATYRKKPVVVHALQINEPFEVETKW